MLEYLPMLQLAHVTDPASGAYFPAEHAGHAFKLPAGFAVPRGHGVHSVPSPFREENPAPHMPADEPPHDVAFGSQLLHAVFPAAALK